MDFFVVIDADSPLGRFLLDRQGKVGGATELVSCGVTTHPAIVGTSLDWGSAPGFLRMNHLRNPNDPQPKPAVMYVPSTCIRFVVERLQAQTAQPGQGQAGPSDQLH